MLKIHEGSGDYSGQYLGGVNKTEYFILILSLKNGSIPHRKELHWNVEDGGAQHAIVHKVANGQTGLSGWATTTY